MKTCTLAFLRRKDEILLAMKKRGFGAGRWNGVGGKAEPGESLQQTMTRECQEEIGITPLQADKVAIHDFVMNASIDPWHMHVHVFFVTKWHGEPQETDEMAPRWFRLSEIPYDDMWQDDILWLPAALLGKKLKGIMTFDQDDNMLTAKLEFASKLQ